MKTSLATLLLTVLLVVLAAPAAYGQAKVKPRSGEGVDAFLLRNGRQPKKYKAAFFELNKGKLGRGNTLLKGVTYTIPPVGCDLPDEVDEPLFGKRLAKVKIKSRELEDACFYIVSGHGGPDPGAIGKAGGHELHEDEYAYDIALRLARNLMERGAKVHIIIQDAKDGIRDGKYLSTSKRETCMGAAIPLDQTERLKQRSDKINALYEGDKGSYSYCRAAFLHIDSRSKKKQMDVFFYYQEKNKSLSRPLAETIRQTFEAKYRQHQPGRGFSGTVSTRGLYVLKRTEVPSVYFELGNLQNVNDQRRFVLSDNRQALANWITEAFVKDYKAHRQ